MRVHPVLKVVWGLITAIGLSLLGHYIWSKMPSVPQVSKMRTMYKGEDIACKVYVNEEYKGDTPLDVRLGNGSFLVHFECPEPYRTIHGDWRIFTEGPAKNITEEVVPFQHKARMQAPKNVLAHFIVKDLFEVEIGECNSDDEEDGTACTVNLPRPGTYRAEIAELCDQEECRRGVIEFSLGDNMQEVVVDWQLPPAQP